MKKALCAFVCLLIGIVGAHAIDEGQMQAAIEQGSCPGCENARCEPTHVAQVKYRDRCQAVCGLDMHPCSPGAPDLFGYDGECQKEVNKTNALINRYNAHLDKCAAAARGASRGPASVSAPSGSSQSGGGSAAKSSQQPKTRSDSPEGPITEAGRKTGFGSSQTAQQPAGQERKACDPNASERCSKMCNQRYGLDQDLGGPQDRGKFGECPYPNSPAGLPSFNACLARVNRYLDGRIKIADDCAHRCLIPTGCLSR